MSDLGTSVRGPRPRNPQDAIMPTSAPVPCRSPHRTRTNETQRWTDKFHRPTCGTYLVNPPVSKVTRITRRNFELPLACPSFTSGTIFGVALHTQASPKFLKPPELEKTLVKKYTRERNLSLASRRRGAVAELSRRRRRRKLSEVLAASSAQGVAQW